MQPTAIEDMEPFLANCDDLNAATRTAKWANIEKAVREDFAWKKEKQKEGDIIIRLFKVDGSTRGAAKQFKDGYFYSTWLNWSDDEIDELKSSGRRPDASKKPKPRSS